MEDKESIVQFVKGEGFYDIVINGEVVGYLQTYGESGWVLDCFVTYNNYLTASELRKIADKLDELNSGKLDV